MCRKFLLIILISIISFQVFTLESPFLGIGAELGFPLRDNSIGESLVIGLTTKFKINTNMGVLFDFFYVNTKYYNFDSGSGWYGPDSFGNIDADTSSSPEWIFYHNEFLFNLNFLVTIPLGKLVPYLSTGPAFLLMAPSEAADFYPDFAASFNAYDSSVKAFLGYMVKTGVEYFIIPQCSIGGEFFFLVPRVFDFFRDLEAMGPIYFRNATHFAISTSFWL
ncbi:MAG: hypothetical protein JXR70_15960 [Spirochaetales bacterium]|nr:hypothetical protein [Spirochaetales bacterium]